MYGLFSKQPKLFAKMFLRNRELCYARLGALVFCFARREMLPKQNTTRTSGAINVGSEGDAEFEAGGQGEVGGGA